MCARSLLIERAAARVHAQSLADGDLASSARLAAQSARAAQRLVSSAALLPQLYFAEDQLAAVLAPFTLPVLVAVVAAAGALWKERKRSAAPAPPPPPPPMPTTHLSAGVNVQ